MAIDTKELRRLAQAATPHVGHACKYQDAHWLREGHVDFENADLFIASERPQEDAAFYAATNPAAITEILDRLEAAENEVESLRRGIDFRDDVVAGLAVEHDALRAKIEAMENESTIDEQRIADLMAELNRVGHENDALRAEITEMEKQEPIGVLHVGSYYGEELQDWEFEANQGACDKLNEAYISNPTSLPLYALPGAKGE